VFVSDQWAIITPKQLCLGLRFFSENITLGSLHVIQSSVSSVYWNISSIQSRLEDVIQTTRGIAAFIGAQAWVQEQMTGNDRSTKYEPKVPGVGEKRGMKIEARGLSFRYPTGKRNALQNINLTIEAGETLAIVGFNGGGEILSLFFNHIDVSKEKQLSRRSSLDYMTTKVNFLLTGLKQEPTNANHFIAI
jgi:ABC-type multidrug transport system fused ATPase/permease subunit